MNRRSRVCLALLLTFLPVAAFPQPCPRVSYTISESATLRKLITTVNCLVANSTEKPEKPEKPPAATPESSTPVATGVQVDAVRIIGPQHRGSFRRYAEDCAGKFREPGSHRHRHRGRHL